MKMLRVKFKGRKYLLTDGSLNHGPIATETQYRKGECSYAYLCPDGTIMRYRQEIGRREDLAVLGEVDFKDGDIEELAGALQNMLTHPSWSK